MELNPDNFPNIISELPPRDKKFFSLMCASYFNGIAIYKRMDSFVSKQDLDLLRRSISENTRKINDLSQGNDHQQNNSTNQQITNLQQQIDNNHTNLQQQIDNNYTNLQQQINNNHANLQQQINTKHNELLQKISEIQDSIDNMCRGINHIFASVRQAIPERLIETNQNDHNQ